ncbi:family 31 glycosyltransferase [Cryphonectria parasitica EP155]|uniref:N-acetylgalactosaminide beta-1,3-galactosyltransferase n=1 Tax=Cryphonectria parasitica (strain ATCC 38755 / EP155) TaxID=660469 RepID=A0A9P4XYD5_CRYP1|nr:family 31 glycosyltransferase [Cryphonectria parasitica EP155]KAF3763184.1 family 31 glycosyltransferase [Cryphonectria parasitica EP155]
MGFIMSIIYRNNRLVPAIIITACLWLFILFLDPVNIRFHERETEEATRVVQIIHDAPQKDVASLSAEIPPPPPAAEDGGETHVSTSSNSIAEDDDEDEQDSSSWTPPKQPIDGQLSPEDVLLIVKTGGTSMWKRLLIHLTTTLAPERIPLKNTVIYSDSPDTIGAYQVIDILANTSSTTLSSSAFEVYHSQREYGANNVYVEAAGVDGDDWGPQGGWVIDKYKFVPLVQHAGENWPDAKWYIYTEDDTYMFLPNLLGYLSQFDHTKAHWLGSYAAKSDVVFAQGGAGFALSRGAWEKSFGRNPSISREYEQYTADHCCGDQVLGHALNRYGVHLGENGGDETFRYGFNPLVHWTFSFEKWSWCLPVYSWHKVHARDVARYYELEQAWDFTKPLTHGDFFMHMIAPDLERRREWWDNMSSKFSVTSANKDDPPMPESVKDVKTWKAAWNDVDSCEAACQAWDECTQWSFVEDLCKMDDKAVMGKGYAPEMSQRKTALMTTSGWVKERIAQWSSHCTTSV